ncbi:glycosyltransferase [Sphingomonas tabacisoli]|uniref:Glycosyltransferase n=1 Tax=Sphingomonas tabacisoli TaxID=2249466 RepID=A0ABW4I3X1_9SPHN
MPLLTIVTVCYRNPADLRATLESAPDLLAADRIEWLIVDGSPDDSCAAVARSFPRAIHLHGPDTGKYDAMNKGIAAAGGRSLLFMNSGDRVADPSALLDLLEERENDLDHVLIYGDSIFVVGGQSLYVDAPVIDAKSLNSGDLPTHQSILIPTLFHRRVSYSADMHFAADTKFLKEAFSSLPYSHVPIAIGCFSYGGVSNSTGSWRSLLKQYRELRDVQAMGILEQVKIAKLLIRRKLAHIILGERSFRAIQARRLVSSGRARVVKAARTQA